MKKFILSLSVLFGLSGASIAQTVSVSDVEAMPGEKVTAIIYLTAPADTYTGVQMALQFPAEGFTIEPSGAVSGWDGFLEYGAMDDEGKVKFAAATSNAFETAAISVKFSVGANVAVGEYPISANIVFEGAEGNAEANTDFVVTVVNRHIVVLDEESATAPEASDGEVDVVLKRTINADEWSTICLPFTATGEQLKAAFGNDVQLAALTAWESEEDNEGGIAAIKVNFSAASVANGIEANTPMLIKVSAPVETANFEAVTVTPEDAPTVQVGKKASERGYFYGTYAVMDVPEENLFLSGNEFWYSTGATSIKGYRGYFNFRDVLDAYYDEGAGVKINFFLNDQETGIMALDNVQLTRDAIYNLAGQRVSKAQSGINIVNGKKIVIK